MTFTEYSESNRRSSRLPIFESNENEFASPSSVIFISAEFNFNVYGLIVIQSNGLQSKFKYKNK